MLHNLFTSYHSIPIVSAMSRRRNTQRLQRAVRDDDEEEEVIPQKRSRADLLNAAPPTVASSNMRSIPRATNLNKALAVTNKVVPKPSQVYQDQSDDDSDNDIRGDLLLPIQPTPALSASSNTLRSIPRVANESQGIRTSLSTSSSTPSTSIPSTLTSESIITHEPVGKKKKNRRPLKPTCILWEFDDKDVVHINEESFSALFQSSCYSKRVKTIRDSCEIIVLILTPTGIIRINVTRHYRILRVLSLVILAKKFGVGKIHEIIKEYATEAGKFVPDSGILKDTKPLLHPKLVDAFLVSQQNSLQVCTYFLSLII